MPIENIFNISEIKFSQNIQAFCPMGDDFYTNQVSVEMQPNEIIPDYCDVEKFMRDMSGKDRIIEDVVNEVFNYLVDNYNPKKLKVTSYVEDAVHFPVSVTKTL